MKDKNITIKLTGHDLFFCWLKGIKSQLKSVLLIVDQEKQKKELRKIIKLLR